MFEWFSCHHTYLKNSFSLWLHLLSFCCKIDFKKATLFSPWRVYIYRKGKPFRVRWTPLLGHEIALFKIPWCLIIFVVINKIYLSWRFMIQWLVGAVASPELVGTAEDYLSGHPEAKYLYKLCSTFIFSDSDFSVFLHIQSCIGALGCRTNPSTC